MASTIKYECVICEEKDFKSRSEWLFHLVLSRHNQKARDNLQQLYLESNGNFYIIGGLQNVDFTLLLDFVSKNLKTFSNIISFKPDAPVCLIVCDPDEFAKFSAEPQYINGQRLTFRNYNELRPGEWKSYFNKDQKQGTPPVLTSDSSSLKPNPVFTGKRKQDECGNTVPVAQPKIPKSDFGLTNDHGVLPDTNINTTNLVKWVTEFNRIKESLLMSEGEQRVRLDVLANLKAIFKKDYPQLELIPIGADFLGFNIFANPFRFYFDSQGIIHPDHPQPIRTVHEENRTRKNICSTVMKVLKSSQTDGCLNNLQCSDGCTIKFVFLVYGKIPLSCALVLKPFQLAHTALLCKQLFFTNSRVMSVVSMIIFWCKREQYRLKTLKNPFNIYWLVYTYLIKVGVLPPIIDLQKSCQYQILDRDMNVAFSYDPKILNIMANRDNIKIKNVTETVKLLGGWFEYMFDVLNNKKQNAIRLLHVVVCPRYGALVEKIIFKVCGEFKNTGINFKKKKKREKRADWESTLVNLGFDHSTWGKLAEMKRPWNLSIQHPFYISDNLSGTEFDKTFTSNFFDALKQTKGMFRLILDSTEDASLLGVLESS